MPLATAGLDRTAARLFDAGKRDERSSTTVAWVFTRLLGNARCLDLTVIG